MHPYVAYAKACINAIYEGEEPQAPRGLDKKEGCFVTITKKGALRGCIGYITSDQPLRKTLPEAARAAALHDPRFPPLRKEELAEITIEVSILTRPKAVNATAAKDKLATFEPGKTGLIVQRGARSGLLLPQVFDANTSPEEAMAMTCRKAGLPTNAWQDETTTIYTFTATIYEE